MSDVQPPATIAPPPNITIATPPSNPGQVDAIIRQQFGFESWMLDIPDLKGIIEEAVANGWSAQEIQGAMMQTNWWRTQTQSQRQFTELQANNPDELNFAASGSQASNMYNHIQQVGAQAGINVIQMMNPTQLQWFSLQAMKNGLDDNQIRMTLGNLATIGYGQTNVPSLTSQMMAAAGDQMVPIGQDEMRSWAQGLVNGTQTMDQFKAEMQKHAASRYPWLAPQIDQGQTMSQIVEPFKQDASNLMEVSPGAVDFVNNPLYQKVLDYVPPGETQHRMMTRSEMDTYLRSTDQWGNTQQARDQVAQQVKSLVSTWGAAKF